MTQSIKKEEPSIHNALSFIQKAQQKDGSFISYSFTEKNKENSIARSTTFYTAFIVSLLHPYNRHSSCKQIQRKGIDFLLSEKNEHWSFNYWKKNTEEYTVLRCPDDLDVICAVFLACFGEKLEVINENALSDFVAHLIATEHAPGGPYNTWIIPDFKNTDWSDTDIAVNSTILYMLQKKEIDLPEIQRWMDRAILLKKYESRYYSPALVLYFISRSYMGNNQELLRDHILEYSKNTSNILEKAALLSSYMRLEGSLSKIRTDVRKLMQSQLPDGSWNMEPFFIEQIKDSISIFSGSSALTTAFCLETLFLYLETQETLKKEEVHRERMRHTEIVYGDTRKIFGKDKTYTDVFNTLLSAIDTKDPHQEISLLSYDFYNALKNKVGIPKSLPYTLGALNILGWIGYTTVDNIIDEEFSSIHHLPFAVRCIREVATGFKKQVKDKDYAHIQDILNCIDSANHIERSMYVCKTEGSLILIPETIPIYKNYDILAHKSLGHALGPITLMLNSQIKNKENHLSTLRSFFTYYIIARQLNDDAHDWLPDLNRGFINSSGTKLLTAWKKQYPDRVLDLSTETEILKEIFWTKTIDTITEEILYYTKKARSCLKKMSFLKQTDFLEKILTPLETSAYKAKKGRDESLAFIKNYTEA